MRVLSQTDVVGCCFSLLLLAGCVCACMCVRVHLCVVCAPVHGLHDILGACLGEMWIFFMFVWMLFGIVGVYNTTNVISLTWQVFSCFGCCVVCFIYMFDVLTKWNSHRVKCVSAEDTLSSEMITLSSSWSSHKLIVVIRIDHIYWSVGYIRTHCTLYGSVLYLYIAKQVFQTFPDHSNGLRWKATIPDSCHWLSQRLTCQTTQTKRAMCGSTNNWWLWEKIFQHLQNWHRYFQVNDYPTLPVNMNMCCYHLRNSVTSELKLRLNAAHHQWPLNLNPVIPRVTGFKTQYLIWRNVTFQYDVQYIKVIRAATKAAFALHATYRHDCQTSPPSGIHSEVSV